MFDLRKWNLAIESGAWRKFRQKRRKWNGQISRLMMLSSQVQLPLIKTS